MEVMSNDDPGGKETRISTQEACPPASEVSCGCKSHPKHRIADIEAPLDVNSFFIGVFMSSEDALVRLAHGRRETDDIVAEPWKCDKENELGGRQLKYTVKYKTPLGLFSQTSRAFETQKILRKDTDKAYVVSTTISTPDVPGGESFSSVMKYCFTSAGNNRSFLRVTCGIDFARKLMFGKKIESMSIEGARIFMGHIESILREIEFNIDELLLLGKKESEETDLQQKVLILEESLRRASEKYSPDVAELTRTPELSLKRFSSLIKGSSIQQRIRTLACEALSPYILLHVLILLCTVAAVWNFISSRKIIQSLNSINSLTSSHPHPLEQS